MAVCNDNVLNKVVLLGSHTNNTLTASVLRRIYISSLTLDVAGMAYGNNAGVSFDKVLKVDFLGCLCELGASLVAVFSLNFKKFCFKQTEKFFFTFKNRSKLCDKNFKL